MPKIGCALDVEKCRGDGDETRVTGGGRWRDGARDEAKATEEEALEQRNFEKNWIATGN